MYKTFLSFLIFFSVCNCFAQDTIVKRDNSIVIAKISEITEKEIKYQKFEFLEGPIYIEPIKDIQVIKYKNGNKDYFNNIKTSEPEVRHGLFNRRNRVVELTLSKNQFSLVNNKYEYNGKYLSENQMYSKMIKLGNPELQYLARKARTARMGRRALPLGLMVAPTGALAAYAGYRLIEYGDDPFAGAIAFVYGSVFSIAGVVFIGIGVPMQINYKQRKEKVIKYYHEIY